jgi:anti-sigma B factor antagonist
MAGSRGTIQVTRHDGAVTLQLQGEFDLVTAPDLRTALLDALQLEPSELVISLHEVTFLEAVTLGVLAAARARLRASERSMWIQGTTDSQAELLRIGGLGSTLAVRSHPRLRTPAGAPRFRRVGGPSAATARATRCVRRAGRW